MMKSYKLDNSVTYSQNTGDNNGPAVIQLNHQNGSAGSKLETNKKKKGKDKKSDKDDKADKEEKRTATFGELYSFTTCCDKFLILIGCLTATIHGASWPLLFLIFGNMTNDFINFAESFLQGIVTREHWLRYDKQQSGELTTRLADDLERIKEGTGDKSGLALQFLSQFLAGFLMGFIKGWKMTLVLMSLTPILAVCAAILGKLLATYSAKEQQKYAKAGAIAEEVLSCIRTVISFNGQPQEIKKFGSTQVNDYNKSGGSEGLSPGNVFTIFFSVMIGSFALGSASPHITSILTAKGAGGTVFSIIKDKPLIDSSSTNGKKPDKINGYIQFKDVEFSYPTRPEAKVIKSIAIIWAFKVLTKNCVKLDNEKAAEMITTSLSQRQDLVEGLDADAILDYLSHHGVLDPAILVGLDKGATPKQRNSTIIRHVEEHGTTAVALFINALRQSGQLHLASSLDTEQRIKPVSGDGYFGKERHKVELEALKFSLREGNLVQTRSSSSLLSSPTRHTGTTPDARAFRKDDMEDEDFVKPKSCWCFCFSRKSKAKKTAQALKKESEKNKLDALKESEALQDSPLANTVRVLGHEEVERKNPNVKPHRTKSKEKSKKDSGTKLSSVECLSNDDGKPKDFTSKKAKNKSKSKNSGKYSAPNNNATDQPIFPEVASITDQPGMVFNGANNSDHGDPFIADNHISQQAYNGVSSKSSSTVGKKA
ncbi:Multidrug resistance protein 1 [Bulinus truncatus]|nr:Multidrug resistance protein 1 [Bulinus truncatus]